MREEDTFEDLTSLFAAEDRALEAKPFVDEVMGKVRRRTLARKAFLLAVGGAGAVVAALQVPSLLGDWITVDNTVVSAISSAQQQAGLLASTNPLWLGIAAIVGLSLAAVATMERT
ncbi:MAG: hypothetical protein IE925_12700 [Rhodobacterales bacterium]|nr:hypothetical protein [Rhodobacterales bacterium]